MPHIETESPTAPPPRPAGTSFGDLLARHAALFAEIEAAGGEITPEQETELAVLTETREPEKVRAIIQVLGELDANAEAREQLASKYAARAKAQRNCAERLRRGCADAMLAFGQDKIKSSIGTLHLMRSESVEIAGPLDERWLRPPKPADPTPDKNAIKAAIKAGTEVSGARLVESHYIKIT